MEPTTAWRGCCWPAAGHDVHETRARRLALSVGSPCPVLMPTLMLMLLLMLLVMLALMMRLREKPGDLPRNSWAAPILPSHPGGGKCETLRTLTPSRLCLQMARCTPYASRKAIHSNECHCCTRQRACQLAHAATPGVQLTGCGVQPIARPPVRT